METLQAPPFVPVREITVYWRPGCGFCARLLANLADTDLRVHKVNLWDDPSSAAFVRSVANGNETVPTVTVGDVSLVNPSVKAILDASQGRGRGFGRQHHSAGCDASSTRSLAASRPARRRSDRNRFLFTQSLPALLIEQEPILQARC